MIMKIEKISDNQIRCTLTRADLADRQLQLSELAYGTEKAKSLFRDMMQQAAFEFGFEAEDIPRGNPFRRFDRADNYKSRGS
jgi:adapter protein MecA 1/2